MGRVDVAIAGGGPAGAVAAILLRRHGFKVKLVSVDKSKSRIEGLSPRVVQILSDLGLPIRGLSAPCLRQTIWGGFDKSSNREYLIERREFDKGLLEQAKLEGVEVCTANIRKINSSDRSIQIDDGEEIRAGIIIEARGRRATIRKVALRGPSTVSISGWTGEANANSTTIRAINNAWVWQAEDEKRGQWTQVVMDASSVSGGRARLKKCWNEVLTEHPIPFPEHPVIRACELRLATPDLDPRKICIGDAALAMDPLSGSGVFLALSSAKMAVPLVKALLDGEVDLARQFYRDRMVEAFMRQARIGRDFYELAEMPDQNRFWSLRASWPDNEPSHPTRKEARICSQIIVRDGRLAKAETLLTPKDDGNVAFVMGEEIVPLLRKIGRGPLLARNEFCSRLLPSVSPDKAGLIHDWLVHRGMSSGMPPITTMK